MNMGEKFTPIVPIQKSTQLGSGLFGVISIMHGGQKTNDINKLIVFKKLKLLYLNENNHICNVESGLQAHNWSSSA